MKGLDNNEMSVRTLQNLKNSLDNRIREIYNQGYREGYKDGVSDAFFALDDLPTIDIVHCKDCRLWIEERKEV